MKKYFVSFSHKIIYAMKRINILVNLLLAVSLTAISSTAKAQTLVLNESFLTQESFNTFTTVSVRGDQSWHFSSLYGAMISGFANSKSNENEDWLISPAMDLSGMDNLKLSFDHARGPAGSISVGISEGWYKVFATANYTGSVLTTTWVEVTGVNHGTSSWGFVSSGELAIPASAKSATTRIAFKYICDDTQSATWEVKNVSVFGTTSITPPDGAVDFKITTWNVEWLSCSSNGPSDTELQINNVVAVIRAMNSDLVALQEVGTSGTYATIDTLVRRLGSEWAGSIAPWNASSCQQNQGIIYKKAKMQLLNGSLMSSGDSYNGNTYSYNWSGGRYPALYNVNFWVGSVQVPVSFVNIHAKAMGDETSYNRRTGASVALKTILDGSAYNTRRVVFLGDFNDYLEGTQCEDCGGLSGISPYKNFMDDATSYRGLTSDLVDPYYASPSIDNIIISNELFDNYVSSSTAREATATGTITNYKSTTSDHTPISITLRFANTGGGSTAVTGVTLNKAATTLAVGQTELLTATVAPSNATNKNVTWSSNNTGVATVSNGLVTAVAAGTAVISVTTADGSFVARCTTTVQTNSVAVTGVGLNKAATTLAVGQTELLTATVAPSNATNQNVAWSSNNTGVATVSNGLVTAVAAGTAVISVTTADGNHTAPCAVIVSGTPTAVDANAYDLVAALYPNPTQNTLTVRLDDGAVLPVEVTVLGITGQAHQVQRFDTPTFTLDVSGCTPGTLLIKIKNSRGAIVKQVVKQ